MVNLNDSRILELLNANLKNSRKCFRFRNTLLNIFVFVFVNPQMSISDELFIDV